MFRTIFGSEVCSVPIFTLEAGGLPAPLAIGRSFFDGSVSFGSLGGVIGVGDWSGIGYWYVIVVFAGIGVCFCALFWADDDDTGAAGGIFGVLAIFRTLIL